MVRDIGVRSQVESYQRLKKWYLMPPWLTLSIIRYESRVKWSNQGKRVAPSHTPRWSSYRKWSFRVTLDYGCQIYITTLLTVANFQNNWKIWISSVDKALFLDGNDTVQAKQWLDKCYLNYTPSEITVKRWYADFKRGCTDTNDAKRSGCQNSTVVPENIKKLHKLILADRKLKLCEIAEELKIPKDSVVTILHEQLSMRKLCSKRVPCLLTIDQKQ